MWNKLKELFRTGTWRRRTTGRSEFQDVVYEPVLSQGTYDDGDDEMLVDQFRRPETRVPWSAVVFAGILCLGGAFLLITAMLLLIGYIDPQYVDRTWPMLVLGFIMFVPGVYHMRIALYAFMDRPGYSFDDIPDFD
ncbi:transmembrane protein 230 isoform X2 [Thrips palmi]|uniref:Transmembrane protein 230 n=1 Tax=Thrips palmi TaxID=161013 RepID=A0A6P8YEV5_THRPL|nr:transmembrane protein 230 isoform X2 [Thrips palmi]